MTREEREKRLAEIDAEIARLKEERKETLTGSIADHCVNTMHLAVWSKPEGVVLKKNRPLSTVTGWEELRKLCLKLYTTRYSYRHQSVKVKDMSPGEIKNCADMADEIILIWNKYMEKIYE